MTPIGNSVAFYAGYGPHSALEGSLVMHAGYLDGHVERRGLTDTRNGVGPYYAGRHTFCFPEKTR